MLAKPGEELHGVITELSIDMYLVKEVAAVWVGSVYVEGVLP